MARLSVTKELAKAIAEGNLERAKELTDILQKKEELKKVKSKPKPKPKPTVQRQEKEPDCDFITNSRDPHRTETYIDETGAERKRMRTEPFVKKPMKNTWEDDLSEESQDVEVDKKLHAKPRKLFHRPPIEKVKVKCGRCYQTYIKWPGEIRNNWVCDDCLVSSRRS